VFFILKNIKIFFFIFLKLFVISAHQNDPKTLKNIYNLKLKTNLNFTKIFLKNKYTLSRSIIRT
jgi:hypothetical protein